MTDVLFATVAMAAGAAVAGRAGFRGWERLALAWPIAAGAVITAGVLLTVSTLRVPPWSSLLVLVTAGVAASWAVADAPGQLRGLLLAAGVGAAAGIAALLVVPTITADSYRYLLTAGLLASPDGVGEAASRLLQKRMIGLPLLHLHVTGNVGYAASVSVLSGISAIASLVSLGRRRTAAAQPLSLLAVLALITMNRFVHHLTYVNGHLLIGAGLLTVFLIDRGRQEERDATWPAALQGLVLAGISVTRPEGFLTTVIVLTGLWLARPMNRSERLALSAPPALVTALWYATVVRVEARTAVEHEITVVAPLVLALLTPVVFVALPGDWLDRRGVRVLAWGAPWLAAAAVAARNLEPLRESTIATIANVRWEGLWGSSLVILAVVLVVTVVAGRLGAQVRAIEAPLYLLVTYVPLAALLVYARDGLYRVGPGDSLARMLMHLVPTALATIVWSSRDPRPQGHPDPGR